LVERLICDASRKIGLICIHCRHGMVEKAHLNPMMYLSTARHAALLLASAFGNDEPIVRALI